jgi:hypothetical protein
VASTTIFADNDSGNDDEFEGFDPEDIDLNNENGRTDCLGLSHHRQVASTTWIKAPKCVYTIKNNKNRNHCVYLVCQT